MEEIIRYDSKLMVTIKEKQDKNRLCVKYVRIMTN